MYDKNINNTHTHTHTHTRNKTKQNNNKNNNNNNNNNNKQQQTTTNGPFAMLFSPSKDQIFYANGRSHTFLGEQVVSDGQVVQYDGHVHGR